MTHPKRYTYGLITLIILVLVWVVYEIIRPEPQPAVRTTVTKGGTVTPSEFVSE